MHGTSFKVYQLVSLALIGSAYAYGAYDFSNLNNLGAQITQNVNEQLAPLQNLGSRINANVQRQLSGLDHLGEHIQQSVYEGLEPVRAMEIGFKMKNGVGGTTIATYLPEGKTFIILNYQMNQCDGNISEEGKCSGSLTPFTVKNNKDYCYSTHGYSIVNNQVCIGASSISVINNVITCRSSTGSPALLTTLDEYKKLCKDSKTVEYKYIADPSNPKHVEIPNKNKYVKCSNNQPGVCIFTETNGLLNDSGNVVFNSYSGGNIILSNP